MDVEPVDGDAVAFHAAEPGHLALGEAADVGVEVVEHLLVGVVGFGEVAGEVLVFEAVLQETFLGDAVVEEALDLVDHAVVEALLEADADAVDDELTVATEAEDEVLHVGETGEGVGVFEAEFLDFEGTDEAVAGLSIGVVVELDEGGETCCELVVGEGLEGAAVFGVDGGVGEAVAADDGFDVHAGAAAEDRLVAAGEDVVVDADEVVLEVVDVVFVAGIADVDEVAWDAAGGEVVFGEVFAGADVHAAEDLTGVGADDFAADAVSEGDGEGGFAAGGGAEDCN